MITKSTETPAKPLLEEKTAVTPELIWTIGISSETLVNEDTLRPGGPGTLWHQIRS